MVQISLQNSGGIVVFLGGSMEPPLGHQREWKYLGHLSVNEQRYNSTQQKRFVLQNIIYV